ncbi:MAG: hypothetical protein WB424_16495 [Terracidiphilus sp.]
MGFSNWGGGAGPTGLSDAPSIQNQKPRNTAAKSINHSHFVIPPVINVPFQAQPIYVPPGTLVSIRAHNGTNAGNVNPVRIGHNYDELSGTGGDPITPDSDISWPCDNTGQIWVISSYAGDGVRISIQAGRTSA